MATGQKTSATIPKQDRSVANRSPISLPLNLTSTLGPYRGKLCRDSTIMTIIFARRYAQEAQPPTGPRLPRAALDRPETRLLQYASAFCPVSRKPDCRRRLLKSITKRLSTLGGTPWLSRSRICILTHSRGGSKISHYVAAHCKVWGAGRTIFHAVTVGGPKNAQWKDF